MKKLIFCFLIFTYYLFASNINNNYTIVLLSSNNIQNAKAFINKNIKEQKAPIFIFKNGKYHIVTYGVYNSNKEISKAIKNLPDNLKKENPYVMIVLYDLYKTDSNRENLLYFKDVEVTNKYDIHDNIKNNESFIDSYSLSIGKNSSHKNTYRVAIQSNFDKELYKNEYGYISGFYDLSYSRWEYKYEDISGISFSPVFVYYFDTNYKDIKPFIDFGIGVSYISKTSVYEKELSTHFQFEDRIGFGYETKSYRVGLSYFHYSNADIDEPNNGMDMIMFTFTYRF